MVKCAYFGRTAVAACLIAGLTVFLNSGNVLAQGAAASSFPDRYQNAVKSVRGLIWDIDDEDSCDVFDLVSNQVEAERKSLASLISQADKSGQDLAAHVLRMWRAELEEVFDEYADYCRRGLRIGYITIEAGVVRQDVSGDVQRLVRDEGGTIYYNFANEKQNATGGRFGVRGRLPFTTAGDVFPSPWAWAYQYQFVNGTSGGTNNGPFGAPGLGVGQFPNGVFTGANTPVTNQYEFKSRYHDLIVSTDRTMHQGLVTVVTTLGARVGLGTVDDTYTFNRPSPPNQFSGFYETKSTVYRAGAFMRMAFNYQPNDPDWTVFGAATFGLDYNSLKSDVTFQLTSPVTDFQKVKIEESETTPNLSLEGGVRGDADGWKWEMKGSVGYGRCVPNVAIPGGGNRPTLDCAVATDYAVLGALRFEADRFFRWVQETRAVLRRTIDAENARRAELDRALREPIQPRRGFNP